jgi:hypothetical protein
MLNDAAQRTKVFMNADELCPGLCPNECLLSTNIVTYRETPRDVFEVLSR